jgi:hypothetical protein
VFADVRGEFAGRILRIAAFLNRLEKIEADSQQVGGVGLSVPEVLDAKGLFFVYLYGAYEKCLEDGFWEGIEAARLHSLTGKELRPELFCLALNGTLDSLESSPKSPKRWQRRLELTRRMFNSNEVTTFDELAVPPYDGSHFRPGYLETIWNLFGITAPTLPEPRYSGRIVELIEKRHDVAHGRERPDAVGRNYTIDDLRKRATDIEACCFYFLSTLESHVAKRANLVR